MPWHWTRQFPPKIGCVTDSAASVDTAINTAAGLPCLQGLTFTGSQLVECQHYTVVRLQDLGGTASQWCVDFPVQQPSCPPR